MRTASCGLLVVLLTCGGCNEPPPEIVAVEGTVTVNGDALPNAEVSFVPMAEGLSAEYIAMAVTDQDGKYALTTGDQDGACACEHKVVLVEGPPPNGERVQTQEGFQQLKRFRAQLKNRPIPEEYTSVSQTPLSVTVTPEQQVYDLALQR